MADDLRVVQEELVRREPIFHRPEFGTTRADFERMTAPDFWEVGASGAVYTRELVLNVLEERCRNPAPDMWETKDFRCRHLGGDAYLLTYTLIQNGTRVTRRATIWECFEGYWRIRYHQGTLLSA